MLRVGAVMLWVTGNQLVTVSVVGDAAAECVWFDSAGNLHRRTLLYVELAPTAWRAN